MQESIKLYFLVRVQCRRKESSRSLSHLMMSFLVFTALHGMQRGLTMRFLSVRLSVCLSVRRVDCDKTKEKSVQIFIPRERAFTLVF